MLTNTIPRLDDIIQHLVGNKWLDTIRMSTVFKGPIFYFLDLLCFQGVCWFVPSELGWFFFLSVIVDSLSKWLTGVFFHVVLPQVLVDDSLWSGSSSTSLWSRARSPSCSQTRPVSSSSHHQKLLRRQFCCRCETRQRNIGGGVYEEGHGNNLVL